MLVDMSLEYLYDKCYFCLVLFLRVDMFIAVAVYRVKFCGPIIGAFLFDNPVRVVCILSRTVYM